MNGVLLLEGKPKGGMGGRGSGMDMESEGDEMSATKPGIMEAKAFIVAVRSGNPEKVLTAFRNLSTCEKEEGEGMDMGSEEKEVE